MQLEVDGQVLLAPDRADLLRAIDETGSITQAARKVGLSYKAAWDAVAAIGRRAAEPVVVRVTGGSGGGGTRLTTYGRHLLSLAARLERAEPARPRPDAAGVPVLRTSARNQWTGRIEALRRGTVKTAVRIALDARHACVAQVTTASASELGLAPGMPVSALVKASAVVLEPCAARRGTPPINRFRGTIAAVSDGQGRAEVTVRVSKTWRVIALVSTRQTRVALEVDGCVELSFAPESVLLVVPA